jgi:hypothetical protein
LEEIRAGENLLKSWGYIQNECRWTKN